MRALVLYPTPAPMVVKFSMDEDRLFYAKFQIDLLRFFSQPLFMKLFKTNDLQIIIKCQSYFGFQLPGVNNRLSERSKKLDAK